MTTYRQEIVDGMARTLWLLAYADFATEADDDDQFPRARGGDDWDDVAPATPEAAEMAATELVSLYETENNATIDALFRHAFHADGKQGESFEQWCEDGEIAYEFGSALAHMAVGSGSSWFDDHKKFEIKKPFFFEVNFDGEDLTWTGGTSPLYPNPAHGPTRAGERSRFHSTLQQHGGGQRSTQRVAKTMATRETLTAERDQIFRALDYAGNTAEQVARYHARLDAIGADLNALGSGPVKAKRKRKRNPGSPMTGPGWSAARDKLRSAAAKSKSNPIRRWLVLSINASPSDTYAVELSDKIDDSLDEAISEALDLALPDENDSILYGVVAANDAGAARLMTPRGGWRLYKGLGPHRDNPGALRFPLVCKHCKRAMRQLEIGRIGVTYEDAVGHTKCPNSHTGEHEPYPRGATR